MTLSAHEFLRRFMCHVLPKGFVRIRSFGFLASRVRDEQLTLCRQLLEVEDHAAAASGNPAPVSAPTDDQSHCGRGVLELVWRTLRPSVSELVNSTYQPPLFDSS